MSTLLRKAYSAASFEQQGYQLISLLAQHLKKSTDHSAMNWIAPEKQMEFWKNDFSSGLLSDPVTLFKEIADRSINVRNPKYMGHQVACPLPLTILSSAFISCLNQSLPIYEMGMVGTALEKIVTDHIKTKFGFGNQSSGIITSGGSLGNLTAILAAKAQFKEKDHPDLVILVSREAHYSIERAAKIAGLPASGLIQLPVNEKFQLQTELLTEVYRNLTLKGKKVLCIVGCACSTSLGVYDDLEAIGSWAREHNIWFHVDGAHGGAAIFSPDYKDLLKGAEQADSIILDFHKLLMAPSLSTALIYRDGKNAKKTFAQEADYLFDNHDKNDWCESGKSTFECTKPMHILNTYMILRTYGDEIYRENIDTLYNLARKFYFMIENDDKFEAALEPMSNIVCFRYKNGNDLNVINHTISKEILLDGSYYIVNTTINGEFWLRVSIQNPFTNESHFKGLLGKIKEIGGKLQEII
ncbi:aminotransferase class V-fold PLP-dependent enzyme [Chryseobacterium gallinarum]|uniref:pyridoxal phosphate-dependent decarboxylase family protein n=1 Tax=Chryseobacterium gallinarum TaxID=1324352 RepID=UPI002024EB05|nr:aminotransferase class V-fold PLP-dependent enzyme [Chryseobacterium gallinarum]MCL8537677.1 aminotransferase class V-fold PLP-dependent enzyme [Chryseobacterium gallinarum]